MARLKATFDHRALLLWIVAAVAAAGLAVWDYEPRDRLGATPELNDADFVDIEVLEEQLGLQLRGDAGSDALP